MALNVEFVKFVLDQLSGLGELESKKMFGGIALMHQGFAYAKIKHDKLWLKVDEHSKTEFENLGMQQYSYGKDGSRKLNFYETPVSLLEDRDQLQEWVKRSMTIAIS